MQLYISQKRYNSTSNIRQWEWNHNDSHLLLINNKEEYNHCSDVKSSFGWVVSYTSLAKLVGIGTSLSLFGWQGAPYLDLALWVQRRLLQLQTLELLEFSITMLELELLACSRHRDKLLWIERKEIGSTTLFMGLALSLGNFHERWQTTFPSMEIRSQTILAQHRFSWWMGWREPSGACWLKNLLNSVGASASLRQSTNGTPFLEDFPHWRGQWTVDPR